MNKIPIVEIFDSIQGEGTHLGKIATFIRTGGCNLKCSWCDAKYAHDAKQIKYMTIEEISNQIHSNFIVITGGEPGLHFYELIKLREYILENIGTHTFIAIESNGTLPLPLFDWHAISPKPENFYRIHAECYPDELKYVVTKDFDADTAISEVVRQTFENRIWLQPNGYDMQNMWKKAYTITMTDPRLRIGVQLHKLMEVQ